jgi:hypothetical protein
VPAEEEMKAVGDSWARTRSIVVDSLTVGYPQSVKCHRMTSLETISKFTTQKSRTASRPRVESLSQRDRVRKGKNGTKIGPHLLCQWTSVDEMLKGLGGRAGMTKKGFRSKLENASAEG